MSLKPPVSPTTGVGSVFDARLDAIEDGYVFASSYSLTGDGVADDSTELQAAINATPTNGVLVLPDGTFGLSTQLLYKNDITIRGNGPTRTILKKLASGPATILGGSLVSGPGITGDPITDLTVEGIGFDGNSVASGAALLHAYSSLRLRVRNCHFYESSSYGLGLQGLPYEANSLKQGPHTDTLLEDCKFYNNDSGGLDVKSAVQFTARRCWAESNTDIGMDIRGLDVLLNECFATSNTEAGFAVRAHADGPLEVSADIIGCRSWANGTGMQLGSSGSVGRERTFRFNVVGGEYRDNTTAGGGGLVVAAGIDDTYTDLHLNVVGGQYEANTGSNMELTFYSTLTITGSQVRDGLSHGINLMSSSPTCLINGVQVTGHSQSSKTGIRAAGTPVRVRVNGSRVTGNTTNITSHAGMVVLNAQTDTASSVASAASVTLPVDHDFVTITGTADITSIATSYSGRRVTLLFSGTAATSGLVDGSNLKLASTLAYTPDDTITLVCDGTNWYEAGRSVN